MTSILTNPKRKSVKKIDKLRFMFEDIDVFETQTSTWACLSKERGHVTVLQDNHQKLLVIDLDTEPQIEMSEDEKFEFVAARILREHKAAFEELAK